jgi:DNA/RNA-binding domain of Phe-tRNA-synthetase-like protein
MMHDITISGELSQKVPGLQLYCIQADVTVGDTPDGLWQLILAGCRQLSESLKLEEISSLPAIKASRQAYKLTGKDPARYRLSAEALLRRAVKEKDLYRINNVVDLLNLVSITTGFSIGGYDASRISGAVDFGIGRKDEPYTGIGRGPLNIEGLPVFRDELGPFGSPTSDSERTSVHVDTTQFLMVIIGFGANELLPEAGEFACELLQKYADSSNLEINNIQ